MSIIDKLGFKSDLQKIIPDVPPETLPFFIDELLEGIYSGWSNMYPPAKQEIPSEWKSFLLSEEDRCELESELSKAGDAYNENKKALFEDILLRATDFRTAFSYYIKIRRKEDWDPLTEDEEEFEGALNGLIKNITNRTLVIPEKRRGRKKDMTKQLLVRYAFVLSDSLLGIKGSRTNSETKFNQILSLCFSKIGHKTSDFKYYITPCFTDYSTIYAMAFPYKKYNRFDLYIEHIKKTEYEKAIRTAFDEEWDTWERPGSFRKF